MSVHTSAGTALSISAAAPSTYDLAGYSALTYTEIGDITDMGDFGREYNLVTHNPISTRATQKRKGSYNEGQMPLKLALNGDDAGQTLAIAASISDNTHSFKLVMQDGDTYYFGAQVMSFKIGVGGVDSMTSSSINLELTSNAAGVGIIYPV